MTTITSTSQTPDPQTPSSQAPSTQEIGAIVKQTLSVIDMMEDISPGDTSFLDVYRKNCHQIPEAIQSGLIRIAVVGVIKSGKSTFINSLTGKIGRAHV